MWYNLIEDGEVMKFKKVYIEITNRCNLACSFCIKNQRKVKSMTLDEFEHVIKQVKPYTDYVYLHVLGEPLLHEQLSEIFLICHKYEMNINLTTNGTLLKDKLSVLIQGKIRQVNISLHNFSEQDINQKEYVHEVCDCAKTLAENNTYVSLRLWNMKNGIIDEETKEIRNEVLRYFHLEHLIPEKAENIKCMSRVFLQFEEQFMWPSFSNDIYHEEGNCLGPKQMLGILSDGTIVPCCLDSKGDITLGNIFMDDLKVVLEGERYLNMVKGFQNRKINEELCKKCGYRQRFDVK